MPNYNFRVKAVEISLLSLARAAPIGWERWQRKIDIFATFEVTHYRQKDRPNAVRVVHEKTGEESWIPLFDDKGVPLDPELMAEFDAIKDGAHRRACCAAIGASMTRGCPCQRRRDRSHPHVPQEVTRAGLRMN
jgi:hypothetical protein